MEEDQGQPDATPENPAKPPQRRPRLKLVSSLATGSRGMTKALWETAESHWLSGTRSIMALARLLQVSNKTAHRLVHKGYPKQGWPPLSERARLYDAQQADVRAAKDRQQMEAEASEMARAKRDNLKVAQSLRALGGQMLVRIHGMLQAFPPSAEGLTTAQAALRAKQMAPIASVYRSVALSLRESGTSELTWIRGAEPEKAGDQQRQAELLATLTAEQWDHIARTGLPPVGVPPEVMQALAHGGWGAPSVSGTP